MAAWAEGREGRTRVCGVRVAGPTAVYLARRMGSRRSGSGDRLLRRIDDLENALIDLRCEALRLAVRVGNDFDLPHADDPLLASG